ncbi:MAG: undecaprenyl/decaprenyl-phosphate alpha-N-acetylglucosaminyl 1-phosphate transferase, partial [Burkholderiaceae bacterium]|nr:undecaprenyl/decaprenyl-phosphate alpha-N-acetylglucosaminyl 1-phosphate transferase [Burkholderiaceae bacterium]
AMQLRREMRVAALALGARKFGSVTGDCGADRPSEIARRFVSPQLTGMTYLALLSFTLAGTAIAALRPLAPKAGLLDYPGGRKRHQRPVPLVGGLGMFVAMVLGLALMPARDPDMTHLVAACALLLAVGALDDRFDVPPTTRLGAHLAAAWLAVLMLDGGPHLSFGNPFGIGELVFTGWIATTLIVVLVAGTINAFNMVDGMDGLAGMMALIALAALCWLTGLARDAYGWQLSLVAIGAVCAFLVFNLPLQINRRWHVFMGDAGSTLLGFLIAVLALRVSQEGRAVAPVTLLWFVAVPVADLLMTILRRLARGVSPFMPDRGHLHHQLLDAGLSVSVTLGILTAVGLTFAALGLFMHHMKVAQPLQFYGFVGAVVLLLYTVAKVPQWSTWLRHRLRPQSESDAN